MESLDLAGCKISDWSLTVLAELPNLTYLRIQGTPVSLAELKKLAAALPRCRIFSDYGILEPARAGLQFDGNTTYVEIPSLRLDTDEAVTLEAFVTINKDQDVMNLMAIAGSRFLRLHTEKSTWGASTFHNDKAQGTVSPNTVRAGLTTHIAAQWDGKELRLFLNGHPYTKPWTSPLTPLQLKTVQGSKTLIGAGIHPQDGKGQTGFLAGTVHEIRVFKGARFPKHAAPVWPVSLDANLIALYRFDEGKGDVLFDASGNNHHGKIVGAKWVQVEGGQSKAPPADPDRAAAELILRKGSMVTVRATGGQGEQMVTRLDKLPAGPIKVVAIGGAYKGLEVTDADAEVLGQLDSVTSMILDLRLTEKGFRRLAAMPAAPRVTFTHWGLNSSPTEAEFAHIRAFEALRHFGASGPGFTDALTKHLCKIPGLSEVALYGTSIGDATLAELKALSLTRLTVQDNSRITEEGMKNIWQMKRISFLDLRRTSLTNSGMAGLHKLPALRTLQLERTRITDAGMKYLAACQNLQSLDLENHPLKDAALEALAGGSPNLDTLYLHSTKVTDDGLKHLKRFPKLKALGLADTAISDAGLPHLAAVKTLRGVNLQKTGVTAGGVKKLAEAIPKCQIQSDHGTLGPK